MERPGDRTGTRKFLVWRGGHVGVLRLGPVLHGRRVLHRAGSERNGRWSNPVNMPGETALSRKPGLAEPLAVSCGATGHCTAVGFFADGRNHVQGFVTEGT